jgi:hypothetical protein
VERAPHPDPLRASFACFDPRKSGAREQKRPRMRKHGFHLIPSHA